MQILVPLLLTLVAWMPPSGDNIADLFKHLQDKYPPSQSETWIIHRVTDNENKLIRDGMNIPGFRADNYVIFETNTKRVIRDIRNRVKKLRETPQYTVIYKKDNVPGVEICIYAHLQGDEWVQGYAVLLQKDVAYFAYVDGALKDSIYQRHQSSVIQLMDEFAYYLSAKAKQGVGIEFFKLLPKDN